MKPCAYHIASVEPSGDDGAATTAEAASRPRCTVSKLLGQRLMAARDFDRQVAEFQVRVVVLNGFTALGTPITEVVG